MAVDFRQRSAGEILQIIKRRKWLLLLPLLASTIAFSWVVTKLPSVYRSTSLLTINPPVISSDVVKSLSDEDISQRLNTINAEVLSRSSIEPMIKKYKLYALEQESGMPMELIYDKVKTKLDVKPEKSDNEKVASFRITYDDRSPEAARNLVQELASKYINVQTINAGITSETTQQFMDERLAEKKLELDKIEQSRLQVMSQNVETLPENDRGLIAQLDGLRRREEGISKEKQDLFNEKSRLNQSISALNGQKSLAEKFGEKDTQESLRNAARVEDTPAYASLIQNRANKHAELDNLLKEYREKHPLVIGKRNEISRINEELEKLKSTTEKRIDDVQRIGKTKVERDTQSIELERQRLEGQIKLSDQQVLAKDAELSRIAVEIRNLEAKLNMIPNVKVALEGINAQYQTAKTAYDDLLKRRNEVSLTTERDKLAQGEQIKVVDPASLPVAPVNASKRYMLIGVGAAIGLLLGLLIAAFLEIPKFFRIQNIEDAKHYTGLPVLASVPPLLSRQEIAWKKRFGYLRLLAGLIAAIAAIPLVAMILQMTKVLDKFVS
ncbi:MAG: hypothetical protein MUC29_01595 [Pyrinomonadaceae bacterium]|jgi:uncharacterized protein involved in exopolysaccharide biosynthesis|nr:hypothetical protein [Pyrinomonadaceae bacterium]